MDQSQQDNTADSGQQMSSDGTLIINGGNPSRPAQNELSIQQPGKTIAPSVTDSDMLPPVAPQQPSSSQAVDSTVPTAQATNGALVPEFTGFDIAATLNIPMTDHEGREISDEPDLYEPQVQVEPDPANPFAPRPGEVPAPNPVAQYTQPQSPVQQPQAPANPYTLPQQNYPAPPTQNPQDPRFPRQ